MIHQDARVVRAIDRSVLAAVVRKSLRRDAIQIQDWHARRLGGGAGNPVSAGLYRVEGLGQDRGEQVAWSVILKIIQSPANIGRENMGEADDPAHWNYWKRELLVYRSAMLDGLPQGMAAPRCFAMEEKPGNTAWMWLEDIQDSYAGVWPLQRYALTARHLGRLNGWYAAAQPLPALPWLSTDIISQWLVKSQSLSGLWSHPRMLARYPMENAFRKMVLESERFIARLNAIPRTICHGDTYPTNFMSRRLAEGQEQTVALDWALVNIGPLGDDLGQFAFGAQANLKAIARDEVVETLLDSYLDGLRDSGCRLDPQIVRFGFAASAALRVGLFQLFMLDEPQMQSNTPDRESGDPSIVPDHFEATMAQKAYELIERMD